MSTRGVNKFIGIGTLGADAETRYTASGSAITSIRIAINESWKDKATGEKQERTEWVRVKFFGRLAEIAGEYLKKGAQVYVEGKLRTDKYTDKDGVERFSTDVIADEMQMLGGKPEGGQRQQRAPSSSAPKSTGGSQASEDDDIPFAPRCTRRTWWMA